MSTSDKPLYTFYKTWGNKILFKYRKNGNSYSKLIDFYQPSLFSVDNSAVDPEFVSIYNTPLKRHSFADIREAKSFIQTYKDVEGFEIHGNSNYANQFIVEFYDGKMPKFSTNDIRAAILDIEVLSPDEFPEPAQAKHPINGVTIYDSFTKKYHVLGMVDYVHNEQHKRVGQLSVEYTKFVDEIALLRAMLEHFKTTCYDLTSGWNSETFDMPYIVNRCFSLLGSDYTTSMLSPFGHISIDTFTNDFGKESVKVNILGLPHLDYLILYKKHVFTPRESYKLGFIAQEELGTDKIDYTDEGTLANLYHKNPQAFTEYNIYDVDIIRQLDDKLGLFAVTYTLAYYTLSNFEDTLGTVKAWEQLVAKFLYGKNVAPLFKAKREAIRDYPGGYVRDPIVGMVEWLMSVDLNSLYPHLEMQVNIGPETYIPRHKLPPELAVLKSKYTLDDLVKGTADLSAVKKHNLSMAANFEFYSKERKSFFSEIKEELYSMRKVYKKQMLQAEKDYIKAKSEDTSHEDLFHLEEAIALFNNLQMAMKILLNAGYGALGNEHFLYFKIENAEAITLTGQLVNMYTSSRVETHLQKMFNTNEPLWIYSDTDSGYFTLKKFHDAVLSDVTDIHKKVDVIDSFIKTKITPFIDKTTDVLADYLNSYANKMVWEREVIAESGVFVAKKRYALKVWDSEGVRYNDPKIKIMGLEAIRSSTPQWARKYLKECYAIALDRDEKKLQSRFAEMRAEFMAMPVEKIAIPRGVNGLEKWGSKDASIYTSGTPNHVKAALIHNYMIDLLGLKINKIVSGNKIKFVKLRQPNPIRQDIIAFDNKLPSEFGLDDYVNRPEIFESGFVSPLTLFIQTLNWNYEETVSLEDFFS
jgi:DNA polymerase elongation subunit (family B)